jgi:hypothetical protein
MCSLEKCLTRRSFDFAAPSTSNSLNNSLHPSQAVWDMWLRRCSTKRGTASPSTSGQWGTVAMHRLFMLRWNADYDPLQVHYLYAPPRIYTFQIRRHEGSRTTNDRSEDQLARWKNNASDEGASWIIDKPALCSPKSAYLTLNSGTQQQKASSVRCLIQTRHAASQRSKRSRIRASQASRRRPSTTYPACARRDSEL